MSCFKFLFTRRITGKKGYIQRCTGFEVHKHGNKTVKIRRTFWAAEETLEKTVISLRKIVNQARLKAKFRPQHYMAVEPVRESVRVPIWSKAFWTGRTGDVSPKTRVWMQKRAAKSVGNESCLY